MLNIVKLKLKIRLIPINILTFEEKSGRMVKKLCLGVDVAESEDEKFGVVYAVEFSPERLDFRID